MKRVLFFVQFLLFISFNFFLFLNVLQLSNINSALNNLDHEIPIYNGKEEFDHSLVKLNSVSKLEVYCDSIFEEKRHGNRFYAFEENYPLIASSVVSKKFFHGYSSYGYSDNFMALMLEPLTRKWASAIVIPDDIMKYPYAACSQQSIVMMELLRRKGFAIRKVGFDGGKKYGGHFCFEAYYNNSWHFFDTDQEPDAEVLAKYNRPGIEFIAKNDAVLTAAYSHWNNQDKVRGLFKSYFYGRTNTFEAPNALIYQKATKFLSTTLWMFFLAGFIFVRRKYLRLTTKINVRNSRIFVPSVTGKTVVSYN
jgi:hypothetical protein